MNRIIKFLGITTLAVCLMAGCSDQTVPKNESSLVKEETQEKSPEKEVKAESDKNPKEEELKVHQFGDTVNVGNMKITLTDIEQFTGEMKQFHSLRQDHAVKIGIVIENKAERKIYVDSYDFKMYDVEGVGIQPAMPSGEPRFNVGLTAGKKTKGTIYFDVPAQEGVWHVHFTPATSYSGTPLAIWEVPAK